MKKGKVNLIIKDCKLEIGYTVRPYKKADKNIAEVELLEVSLVEVSKKS